MAVSSVVMAVEGVLKKHVTNAPIPVGIALYHGLANTFNVLLVCDISQAELDRWCALEGLNRHAATRVNEGVWEYNTDVTRRLYQVDSLRNTGYNIDLVIEPDPSKSAKMLQAGYTCMTFTHADYALPQWRPDYEHKVKPWDEIAAYQEKMAELRAIDILTEGKPL